MNPVAHLVREAGAQFSALGRRCDELTDEMRAFGLLIERYPGEFEEILNVYRLKRRLTE